MRWDCSWLAGYRICVLRHSVVESPFFDYFSDLERPASCENLPADHGSLLAGGLFYLFHLEFRNALIVQMEVR